MNYLVISDKEITYHDTATAAAIAAGCYPWDWFKTRNAIAALNMGDELDVTATTSVLRISGTNPSMM